MKRDRKARGIPLDELLAANAAGDDRLNSLVSRYRSASYRRRPSQNSPRRPRGRQNERKRA